MRQCQPGRAAHAHICRSARSAAARQDSPDGRHRASSPMALERQRRATARCRRLVFRPRARRDSAGAVHLGVPPNGIASRRAGRCRSVSVTAPTTADLRLSRSCGSGTTRSLLDSPALVWTRFAGFGGGYVSARSSSGLLESLPAGATMQHGWGTRCVRRSPISARGSSRRGNRESATVPVSPVRRISDRYVCEYCGAWIDAPRDQVPRSVLTGKSGQPSMRVLSVDGREVHRCEVGEPRFDGRGG